MSKLPIKPGPEVEKVLTLVEQQDIKFVDLRFTDLRGKEHHITVPAAKVNKELFAFGKAFDGSSLAGWATIDKSDMLLVPVPESAVLDPFREAATLNIRCAVYSPDTGMPYGRDPRAVAERGEQYLKETGIAEIAYFGQEIEFFIFDDVRWSLDMSGASYSVDSNEAVWNNNREIPGGNMGYRPGIKGGYFPVPPVDSSHDLRSEMCLLLQEMGMIPEIHHHEVATANQNEIVTRYDTLVNKCDEIQVFKYCIKNVAHEHGKTVTFMPKPIVGDNGSAMHTHQSLSSNGKNLFSGDDYAGLSEMALHYIGGILKHARALNAFTNPATNSYKRLVPGFEAPVKLAYSACNRSAAIRIPHVAQAFEKRFEARFPDPLANSYLAFTAMLMAGIDGIKNKIHPGEALDQNLYDLPAAEAAKIPDMCASLHQAIEALKADHDFLLEGGVFTKDILDSYIALKQEEVTRHNSTTHPVEFDMYYAQ